MKTVVCWGS